MEETNLATIFMQLFESIAVEEYNVGGAKDSYHDFLVSLVESDPSTLSEDKLKYFIGLLINIYRAFAQLVVLYNTLHSTLQCNVFNTLDKLETYNTIIVEPRDMDQLKKINLIDLSTHLAEPEQNKASCNISLDFIHILSLDSTANLSRRRIEDAQLCSNHDF